MAIFTNFLSRQRKKQPSILFLGVSLVFTFPAIAQTDPYNPPKQMFEPPPLMQQPAPRSGSRQYVRPSVKSRVSSPDDAEIDKDYKPYIPNFAPAPIMPEPIEESPGQTGVDVQSVIAPSPPPLPGTKPVLPVKAAQPAQAPAPIIETPEIPAPVIESIAAPKVDPPKVEPPAPAEKVEVPAPQIEMPVPLPVKSEEPPKPLKTDGVVTGPKTMPAAPATDVTAEQSEPTPSDVKDGDLFERHAEQAAQEAQQPTPVEPTSMPDAFKSSGDKSEKLMVFDKGESILSEDDIKLIRSELAIFLKSNPGAQLDIVGYASLDENEPNADKRIALARIMAVRSFLVNEGVKPEQLNLRAMGSKTDKKPLDRVDLFLK